MHTFRVALLILGAALATVACKDTASAGTDAPNAQPGTPPVTAPSDGGGTPAGTPPAGTPTDPPASDPPQTQKPGDDPTLTACTDPRPGGVCTREYRPVCGIKADGKTATYPNKCNACSDAAVVRYKDGACS